MAERYGNPVTQYLDDAGNPLINGKLFFFTTGTNTALDTFADINLAIANTNPVILTAAGRIPNIFLKSASYKVILTTSADVQIFERDPVGAETEAGNWTPFNSLTIYGINDIVEGSDGNFYISLTEANQGNDPVTTPASWSQIKLNFVFNTLQTYKIGDLVMATDLTLYVSLTNNNLNNDPASDVTNWKSATSISVPNVVLAAGRIFGLQNF